MGNTFYPGQAVTAAVETLETYSELSQYTAEEITGAWGLACSFDIYGCDPDTIRDAEKIKEFVVDLCELIDMKRYGECQVVHFGEDEAVAGFSMTQLIETSLISAHFANKTNAVYLDVFSCKAYDPNVVKDFATSFFGGDRCVVQISLRK